MTAESPVRVGGSALRRRPQLSEDVASHLRSRIMSGLVRPGDFIRLDETAAELGVSVTPVREALLTLRGEGVVELVPHRGYVVAPLSREDVTDIFWLQGQIAVELALRAARKVTEAEILELEGLNAELAAAVGARDTEEIVRCEFDFHRTLNLVAGGYKLAWFLHNAIRYTPHRLYAVDPAWGELAVRSHTAFIVALRSTDLDAVAQQTQVQFIDGAERLIAHLEQSDFWR